MDGWRETLYATTHLCLMEEMCTVGMRSTLCLLHISSRANTLVEVTCHIISCHSHVIICPNITTTIGDGILYCKSKVMDVAKE